MLGLLRAIVLDYWPEILIVGFVCGLGWVTTRYPRPAEVSMTSRAVRVLAAIADAYDENNLDDEARKRWGANYEHTNTRPPEEIILYSGRGGGTLFTLADCLAAREERRDGE